MSLNREDALRPRLTPEFVATLIEAAKVIGHGVDHTATCQFVQEVAYLAGVQQPTDAELTPYPDLEP